MAPDSVLWRRPFDWMKMCNAAKPKPAAKGPDHEEGDGDMPDAGDLALRRVAQRMQLEQ